MVPWQFFAYLSTASSDSHSPKFIAKHLTGYSSNSLKNEFTTSLKTYLQNGSELISSLFVLCSFGNMRISLKSFREVKIGWHNSFIHYIPITTVRTIFLCWCGDIKNWWCFVIMKPLFVYIWKKILLVIQDVTQNAIITWALTWNTL